MKEKMKLAFCLHGMVGNSTGKHSANKTSEIDVLKIAYENHKKMIFDHYDVDIFVHSWSVEMADQIVDLYNPLRHHIEEQIQFEVPAYIKARKERAFAHLSRWYSFAECVNMVDEYVEISKKEEVDIVYDHVYVQRFDLLWNVVPKFEEMDSKYFWIGKSTLNTAKEWSDRWFSSNLENMEKFAKLFDKIPEYMNGGPFPSNKQYAGISSHMLSRYHALCEGLQPRLKYNFGGYGQKPNEYNEIRRQIFGNDQ